MYTTIGSFDAKAQLSALLRYVKAGKRYTITLRGQPVADLIPSEALRQGETKAAIDAMKNMPKIRGVSASQVKALIEEGRQ